MPNIFRLLALALSEMKQFTRVKRQEQPEMSVTDAVQLLQLFAQYGIEVIVDGGWGVDALLGVQTRTHRDLDIALQHRDVPQLRALLEAQGYREVPLDYTCKCHLVLGDGEGHEVDIHSYTFDADGKFIFGFPYPPDALTRIGSGTIQGYPVKCISVGWQIKLHLDYPPDEDDYYDVAALCQRFGIALPAELERFTHKGCALVF